MKTEKSLGQHWLQDQPTLDDIVGMANIRPDETILEVGPGTGTLTARLLERQARVVAVEKDKALAARLATKIRDRGFLLHDGDILKFDLNQLPAGYKVVANIPYYLTSNLLRLLSESRNSPGLMVLLVQKEVAQRLAAGPGQMGLLSVSVQLNYEPQLGRLVPAELFEPPPQVDSQIIVLRRRPKPLFADLDSQKFFRIVKAGFSQRRKKLRSSLSGGLGLSKEQAEELLRGAGIAADARAQELSLQQWYDLAKNLDFPARF